MLSPCICGEVQRPSGALLFYSSGDRVLLNPVKGVGRMASDEEILQLWKRLSEKLKGPDAITGLYRNAQGTGRQEGILAMENELVRDETVEKALKGFGWGKNNRAAVITTRAVIREAAGIAKGKVGK